MKFFRNTRSNRAKLTVSVICIYDNFNNDYSFTPFVFKTLNFWYCNKKVSLMQTSFSKSVSYFDVILQECVIF